MNQYEKTLNVFKRDPETKCPVFGEWASPELDLLQGLDWEFTEKIDGTNVRVIWWCNKVEVRGRSDNAEVHPEVTQYLMDKNLTERFTEIFPPAEFDVPICIYGEAFGAGIQKGGKYSPVKSFAAFDVKVGHIWLRRADAYDVASKLGLKRVPHVATGTLLAGVDRVSRGVTSHFGDFYAEGLVARPPVTLLNNRGERIMCKIKHKEFFCEEESK